MNLGDLKTQALRYLALGEQDQALLLYQALVRHLPADLDTRMKIADVLVQASLPHLACRVYAAVAWFDLQAGRPLHALVCCQALSDLGQSVSSIHESLAALYGAHSPRLSRGETGGGRVLPPDPQTEVTGFETAALSQRAAAEVAAEMAADTHTFSGFPPLLSPVPLLSELPEAAFARLSQAALIRRLGPRVPFIKEGVPGYSIFFLASGSAEIYRESASRTVLGRLGEGAVVGELALCTQKGRSAGVETCEPSDLIELPIRALRTVAAEMPEVEAALARFTRERVLRALLSVSPVFHPFTTGQRLDLLRRFVTLDLADDTILFREGEIVEGLYVVVSGALEVVKGEEPFETVEGHLAPGEMLGELALLRQMSAPAMVRASGQASVLLLSRESFERICNAVPGVPDLLERLAIEHARELGQLGRWALPSASPPIDLSSLVWLSGVFGPAEPPSTDEGEFPFLV